MIYVGAIVMPVAVFLWLGIRSYENQRQALKLMFDGELDSRTTAAARTALEALSQDGPRDPIVRHVFAIDGGRVVRPAPYSALPDPLPEEFAEAQRLEDTQQYPLALEAYQRLRSSSARPSLALQGMARCLERLSQGVAARDAWLTLAGQYPDERTLSHRPYGIYAAMMAGATSGLYETIESGRWDLPGDYATHVLEEIDPRRAAASPYLDRFAFARELDAEFRQRGTLVDNVIYDFKLPSHLIFFRSDGPDRIVGFSANDDWIATTLRHQVEREFNMAGASGSDRGVYFGSVALMVVVLSAGVVLLLRDVSRERRTNQARAEVVSGVSHELKTPITLVRLYSETLLRHRDFSDEDRVGFYRILARESTRLGRLVDQVLTFSRVDRGAQVYHFEEGDLTSVVAGVVEDYREYLEHAGFRLSCTMPDELPPVRIDGAAISQALLNLLDNAVKYSGQSRDIEVRVVPAEHAAAIEVVDHGVGIDAAEHTKIFDRFYRVANGSGKGGYGLGLFLVRHIVEAHGGRVEVDSEPGRGSRFRLIIPVATAWASASS